MAMKIDGVLLEVINNTFMSVAEEMGAVLVKSAYSTNIKERKDCSCGVFDANGETIAQAEHIPMHLGSMLDMVKEILRVYPKETIKEGDMFIGNDAYNGGGTHLPDITIAAPVFWEGEIIAFCINIAHHNDVGGRVPGSNAADSSTIYEEGIRIPPVRIFRDGVLDDDILRLVLLNCRVNDIRRGDLHAQFACNRKGIQRIHECCEKYGKETIKACMEEMLNYSERKMRKAISELPDGVATFEDYLDSDGKGSAPIPMRVTVEIKGEDIYVDFTDNVPQVKGALNMTFTATLACVYYSMKSIVDPSLPANAGYYRPIHCILKPGTLLCCKEPAAIAARTDTAQRVVSIIFGAMSKIVPNRVIAGSHDAITGVYFGGTNPETDKYYIYVETMAGGSGARFNKDGLDAVQVHMTNTSNLPIECLEIEYPLRVECLKLMPDSGGAGKYRGGLGMRKDIRILNHECNLSVKADRQKMPPWGIYGGKDGTCGEIVLNYDTDHPVKVDGKKSNMPIPENTIVSCITPGSGGYGNPAEREIKDIIFDLEQGLVTKEAVLSDYPITEEMIASAKVFTA